MKRLQTLVLAIAAMSIMASGTGVGAAYPTAKQAGATPAATALVTVTPATYIRAETDRNFTNLAKLAGGVNKLFHFRRPTPLDKQTVVRMNLDTLYSASIVDTTGGATITVPAAPKGRYLSAEVVDNDHYCPSVFYEPGVHPLQAATKYVAVLIRVQLFNPNDPAELALVNKLQDQFVVTAKSADPFPAMTWEPTSLKALTDQYEKDAKKYTTFEGMMGPRGKVNEKTRHLAVAAGWGLFPEWESTYMNYSGGQNATACYRATYQVPENKAFWSITVYGSDGFMKSANAIVNSSNVKLDPAGTATVHFGPKQACGDVSNRVDTSDGWNYILRIYRPGPSVLNGTYKLPTPELVK
ncbi:MAG: DUF1254 domain-containing protein [Acidobacteria bacterium]|nr:DUF1254 domain-containing protein [Acidobacteriota bacterium]